jgi:hypothetical protein
MQQKHVIIGLSALILVLAVALAFVIGGESAEPIVAADSNTVAPPQPAPVTRMEVAGNVAAPTPAPAPKAESDEELREWIVGGWNFASSGCENDGGEFFAPDGRYGNCSEEGRWRLVGGRLTYTITHEFDEDEGVTRRLPAPRVSTAAIVKEAANRMRKGGERMIRSPQRQSRFQQLITPAQSPWRCPDPRRCTWCKGHSGRRCAAAPRSR